MNEIVITISILFIGYTYFGYPLILWVIGWFSKESEFTEKTDHKVTVLFSAYNEEEAVARTLHSIMESNYPRALLNVLVVSDGSTDRTDEIVQSFNNKRVKLIRIQQREGKNRALANVYQQAVGEILVFVDASSIFKQDSVRNLVRINVAVPGKCHRIKLGWSRRRPVCHSQRSFTDEFCSGFSR